MPPGPSVIKTTHEKFSPHSHSFPRYPGAHSTCTQYLGAGWSDNFGTINCSFTEEEGQCDNEFFGSITFNTSLQSESIQGTGTLEETFDGDNEFQLQATIEEDNTLGEV